MNQDREKMIAEILKEARAEDAREGGRFDRDGWGNFFLEDWKKDHEAVEEAWRIYNDERNQAEDDAAAMSEEDDPEPWPRRGAR